MKIFKIHLHLNLKSQSYYVRMWIYVADFPFLKFLHLTIFTIQKSLLNSLYNSYFACCAVSFLGPLWLLCRNFMKSEFYLEMKYNY